MKYIAGLTLFCLMPLVVLAATFPSKSIFLSEDPVLSGDTVLIHVVISNNSNSSFSGTLSILDGKTQVGTLAVSLAAEEAQVESLSWKPGGGSHILVADLYDSKQFLVQETQQTFNVSLPTPSVSTLSVESSQGLDSSIAQVSPKTAQVVAPALATIDIARQDVVQNLSQGIAWAQGQINLASSTQGKVLGVETTNPQTTGVGHTLWMVLATAVLYVLSVLRSIVSSVGLFYPVIAIIFLYILWRIFRGARRPSRY